jgi:uncharacterized protein DUF3987
MPTPGEADECGGCAPDRLHDARHCCGNALCLRSACRAGRTVGVISAEGGIFDIITGRCSGNVPHMDLWRKGHSGDPLKVDRKGCPPEYVRRPALTLGLMIQPEVLDTIAATVRSGVAGSSRASFTRGRCRRWVAQYRAPASRLRDQTLTPIAPEGDTGDRGPRRALLSLLIRGGAQRAVTRFIGAQR